MINAHCCENILINFDLGEYCGSEVEPENAKSLNFLNLYLQVPSGAQTLPSGLLIMSGLFLE